MLHGPLDVFVVTFTKGLLATLVLVQNFSLENGRQSLPLNLVGTPISNLASLENRLHPVDQIFNLRLRADLVRNFMRLLKRLIGLVQKL